MKYIRSNKTVTSSFIYRYSIVVIISLLACGIAGAGKILTTRQVTLFAARHVDQPARTKPTNQQPLIKSAKSDRPNVTPSRNTSALSSPSTAIELQRAVAMASGSSLFGRFSITQLGSSNISFPSAMLGAAPVDAPAAQAQPR